MAIDKGLAGRTRADILNGLGVIGLVSTGAPIIRNSELQPNDVAGYGLAVAIVAVVALFVALGGWLEKRRGWTESRWSRLGSSGLLAVAVLVACGQLSAAYLGSHTVELGWSIYSVVLGGLVLLQVAFMVVAYVKEDEPSSPARLDYAYGIATIYTLGVGGTSLAAGLIGILDTSGEPIAPGTLAGLAIVLGLCGIVAWMLAESASLVAARLELKSMLMLVKSLVQIVGGGLLVAALFTEDDALYDWGRGVAGVGVVIGVAVGLILYAGKGDGRAPADVVLEEFDLAQEGT